MHGELEAVTDVRQRAADDDRHGVVEVGAAHLLLNVDGDEVCGAGTEWAVLFAGKRELGILFVSHGLTPL